MRAQMDSRRRMRIPSVRARMREWFAFTRFDCEFFLLPISNNNNNHSVKSNKKAQEKRRKGKKLVFCCFEDGFLMSQ